MDTKNKKGLPKIAIVGTSSLFPGAIDSKDFWLNILNERDFIRDVPETHWLKEDYFDPEDKTGDKVYCQKGAFLDNIDFDPVEFGMPPNLLKTTDTVQLLSLVVARDTLADTISYVEGKVDSKKVSVILGVAGGTELFVEMSSRVHKPEWVNAMRAQGLPESKIDAIKGELNKNFTHWNENTFPGLLGNVVSGRISNRFNFNGTNCVLDAACASSLAAVKMAVQELQLGSVDMVVTGGSDALNDISMYMCFSQTTALSPSQDCAPFSDKGDGTVLGEGVAMMTLKRLEDAERDGDKIYSVISAIGSSSDGRSGSIYAPDANGQSLAIKRSYEEAGFTPDQVDLVEAHGTGTMAGDYQEFNGLQKGFGETEKKQFCAIGSVKSMIGHTKSCAGAASLLKASLALNNKILPPTIKVDQPNPKLDVENSPFYINTKARPWIHVNKESRKAGVSSMGFGGTNFHVALEEYDKVENQPKRVYKAGKELLLFSGKSQSEITKLMNDALSAAKEELLTSVAKKTQSYFKETDECRLSILASDFTEAEKWVNYTKAEFAKQTISLAVNNSVYYSQGKSSGRLAYLFSGQGSQYINMGSDLLMQYSEALAPWDKAAGINLNSPDKLNDVVYPIPVFNDAERATQATKLTATEWAQPAIGTLALSHLAILKDIKVSPDVVGGHSYGEVAALYAAGVISSEEELIEISRKRGELMAAAGKNASGTMTAVFGSEEKVQNILTSESSSIVVANINSPKQTVVTGDESAMDKVEKAFSTEGLKFQRLKVSTAFHSKIVAKSAVEFEKYLNKLKFTKAQIPVYSNTTATPYPGDIQNYAGQLAKQLAAPVKFVEQIQNMYAEGVRTFLEVGPNKVLSNFIKDILKDQDHKTISIDGGHKINSKDALWSALGQLAVTGQQIDFDAMWTNQDDNTKAIPAKKASIASVKINGSNFEKPYPPVGGFAALAPKNPETPVQAASPVPTAPITVPAAVNNTVQAPVQMKNTANAPAARITQKNNQTKLETKQKSKFSPMNNQWLEAFQEIQRNTLEAHKNAQQMMAESHRMFLETSQMAFNQLGSINGGVNNNAQHEVMQQSYVAPVQQVAAPTTQPAVQAVAQPVVQPRVQVTQPVVQAPAPSPVAVQAPVAVAPVVEVQAATPDNNVDFENTLLDIVSEKTGYPKDILDLTTDLESGLGIDSIKRVEILSALQEVFPELKEVDTAKLAAMNTLGEILDFSKSESGASNSAPAPTTEAPVSTPVETPAPITSTNNTSGGEDFGNFKNAMLEIVSEKTGYPKEILDLTTDLESGLGIDSIKRVEILSALQESYPSLKEVDTAKLAAMNTLEEILNFATESQANKTEGEVVALEKK